MGDAIAASGAQAELTALAERLGAVVWGVNCSEVNMPASHPLFGGFTGHMFGDDSRPITAAADAVLICGTTIMPEVFPALEGVFAENAAVIHFDLNVTEIAKNFPVRVGALGDPKPTLARLAAEIGRLQSPAQCAEAAARTECQRLAQDARRQKSLAHDASVRDYVPLAAARFMEELARRLPADAVIFDEALTNSPALCRHLPQDRPGTYFQTRAGMLGTGLPGALGLKVACPDKVVFGFCGDGGGISTIQALATAARHDIGVKFVVCNNRSYRILKFNLQRYWADFPPDPARKLPASFDLSSPELRFDLLAEGQGVAAVRVERPEEIAPALDRALADDRPFLIELILDAEL
jgi:benzoylformate decarboxylase